MNNDQTKQPTELEQNARLHEALYNTTITWRYWLKSSLHRLIDSDATDCSWSDSHELDGDTYFKENMVELVPCFKNDKGDFQQVPRYCSDIAAAWQAEGALPDGALEEYIEKISEIATDNKQRLNFDWDTNIYAYNLNWLMRRATPAQMVQAMISALEGK